jgi:hypothetical protein
MITTITSQAITAIVLTNNPETIARITTGMRCQNLITAGSEDDFCISKLTISSSPFPHWLHELYSQYLAYTFRLIALKKRKVLVSDPLQKVIKSYQIIELVQRFFVALSRVYVCLVDATSGKKISLFWFFYNLILIRQKACKVLYLHLFLISTIFLIESGKDFEIQKLQ